MSLSVVRVCLATSCGPVYLCGWRSPFSVPCLSGRAQQGFQTGIRMAWIHCSLLRHVANSNALECSWRRCLRSIASLLVHSELGPTGSSLFPASDLACKCRRLKNGVSHRVPVFFVHLRAVGPLPHSEKSLTSSVAELFSIMALDRHAAINSARASSCCRPDSPLGGCLLGLQQ